MITFNSISKEERTSYGFGMTKGWVNVDRSFIYSWTVAWIMLASALVNPELLIIKLGYTVK